MRHSGVMRSVYANEVVNDTRPAKEHEYADLYEHLIRIGFDIHVRLKQNYTDELIRENKLREATDA
jgi:hypothetical protein